MSDTAIQADLLTLGVYPVPVSPAGEVGVLNAQYPIGDVRRYGVFPDGVDLTGLGFTSGSPTVTAAAGTFTAAMVGMIACSPNACATLAGTPLSITAVAGDGSSATLSANAIATQAGAGARVGTWWENKFPAYTTAILTNSVHPNITILWPRGKYVTSLNFASAYAGSKMHFDKAEFSSIFHIIADAGFPGTGAPMADCVFSGQFITYDRFGSIGLLNSDLSMLSVTCRSDPTKNLFGTVGRGVHIYTQIIGNKFGNFTIEYCGIGTALNTDAALCFDSSDGYNNSFGNVWIKDCDGHGVYVIGSKQRFASIRVDGYGALSHDRQLQESISLAQSQELCGVWFRRCSGLRVDNLSIDQPAAGRANALYDMRIEDTATATAVPSFYSTPHIRSLTAANQRHRGVSIGDRNNVLNVAQLVADVVQLEPVSGATLDVGYSMIHVNANANTTTQGRSKLISDRILVRNLSTSINDVLQVPALTEVDIAEIDTAQFTGHAGRIVTFTGKGRVGRISHAQSGSSSSPTPITVTSNDGPVYIGQVDASAATVTTIAALDLTSATNFEVGPVTLTGYRGSPVIKLISATYGLLKLGNVSETTVTGWGLRWQTCTNVRVEGGKITGFAVGTTGSGAGNVRCSAVNLEVSGNTANTNMTNGQVLVDTSDLNVTL